MKERVSANGEWIPENGAKASVTRVFPFPKPVSVGKVNPPRSYRPGPRIECIRGAAQLRKCLSSPAVMIAGEPQHFNVAFPQVCQSRQYSKSRSRHNVAPREPEIEKIPHYHEGSCASRNRPQVVEKSTLCVRGGDTDMSVTDYVAGSSQHEVSLMRSRYSSKHLSPDALFRLPRLSQYSTSQSRHFPFSMITETTTELRVRYAETDQMGVVYHANYLVWCEIGRTDFIREMGKPYSELERDGVRLAVSDVTMRFHSSARYDDPVRVHTRLVDARSRSIRFSYRIRSADSEALLVSASTTLICIDHEGRLARLPEPLRASLASALSKESDHGR